MTDYAAVTWRLLITSPADGATNMAIDEALLHALADGAGRPTLRFYQWLPPCLSLGYNEPCADVDEAACARLGYTWVRRPTGGRAILHTDELTYSVTAPESEPRVAGSIVNSYRQLSAGLLAGLHALGADVFQAQTEKVVNPDQGAACFDTPSNYEITVGGKKLVGSAQVRRRGIVLQHGALPLTGDLTRIFNCLQLNETTKVFRHPVGATLAVARPACPGRQARGRAQGPPLRTGDNLWSYLDGSEKAARAALLDHACTLEEALGRVVSFEEAAQALARGFAGALNLHLEPAGLTEHERSLVERLRRDQYAGDSWNRRI